LFQNQIEVTNSEGSIVAYLTIDPTTNPPSFSGSFVPSASDYYVANYPAGDPNYIPSHSPAVAETVNPVQQPQNLQITLVINPTTSNPGQAIAVSGTVTPIPAPAKA
jgi:hypothetical protein